MQRLERASSEPSASSSSRSTAAEMAFSFSGRLRTSTQADPSRRSSTSSGMRGEAVELVVANAKLVRGEPKEDLAHPLRRHPRASKNRLEPETVDERDEAVRDLIRGSIGRKVPFAVPERTTSK